MIAETSRAAYHETRAERALMCATLKNLYSTKGPLTDREASRYLGWHPSEVSARRNDLYEIMELGQRRDEVTGKLGKVWGPLKLTLDI